MTAAELIARLEAATEGECVNWPGKKDRQGRGRIQHSGKTKLAHRWAWEIMVGPIEAGKMLCHKCDNPSCINPKHLYVGTHADNMRDMSIRKRTFAHRYPDKAREVGRASGLKNTWARGDGNPKAKLTLDQVILIRCDHRPTRFLVVEYGVSRSTIQRIRALTLWPPPPLPRSPSASPR